MKEKVYIVFFDADMKTETDRKIYQKFIKDLKREGFLMLQKSVYVRYINSSRTPIAQAERIKKITPQKIHVYILPLSVNVFMSTVCLNSVLPDIIKKNDIICI